MGLYKEEGDDGSKWPVFNTIEEWDRKPGRKLQVLIHLVQFLLADDANCGVGVAADGSVKFSPAQKLLPGVPPSLATDAAPSQSAPLLVATRKVLIHHQWTMMTDTILSAFRVHNVEVLAINGSSTMATRAAVVSEFIHSVERRVLLFSEVGVTGLNLACADCVVHYVGPSASKVAFATNNIRACRMDCGLACRRIKLMVAQIGSARKSSSMHTT